jgi:osmoprotectant transport system ATP-binding protein
MDVEFQNVSFDIAGRPILRNLSLRIAAGETLVLLGASGSGKTTALRLINGLLLPTSGRVLVQGKPTTDWDLIALRRSIGYVIQEAGLLPHLTVQQNVGLVPRLLGWPAPRIHARAEALLADVQLDPAEFGPRFPAQLSGGQRQRVGVARALAADPGLLLFDEPFGALDPLTRLDLQRQFLSLRRRYAKTAVFVTHDISEALRLGTHIALLDSGALQAIAPVADFPTLSHPLVKSFLACLNPRAEDHP